MKADMQVIGERAQSIRGHNETVKREQVVKMLKVYELQREKSNLMKVNERLKYINVLRQSLPVIQNLIETGSNFDVILELLQNSNDLIDNKLGSL